MKLLGPVFWYDLIRVARRQRLALWRALYAAMLLVALYLLYSVTFPQAGLLNGVKVPGSQQARFATAFFAIFAGLQFAAVILLTPALTATALADERSHNTLTFLFTTHLTNREIILGKLIPRLIQVGLLILTGLPVLGLMQLFGGVDQLLVLAAFAATAVTLLSTGCLGIACAVFSKKPQNAVWRAYQWLVLYAAVSTVSIWLFDLPTTKVPARFRAALGFGPTRTGFFANSAFGAPTPAQNVMEVFNAANPFFAFQRIVAEMANDTDLTEVVPQVLRDYVIYHGAIAFLCGGLAIWRLRAVAARRIGGLTLRRKLVLKPAPHPRVKDRPVLWKEFYCETKPRQRWLALFFTRWFFAASFLPTWVLMVFGLNHYEQLTTWAYLALAFGGTLVASALLLRVATQAARSIGSERDRQTLDSLLTTMLRPDEIVRDKWWGSFLAGRWVFIWLLVHWGLGLLAMAVHFTVVPLLILEVLVFAAFMTSLGLYFAARAPTTKQAMTATLVIGVIGTSVLPWMLGKFLMVVLPEKVYDQNGLIAQRQRFYREERVWPETLALGLTPVRVLYESVVPNYEVWPGYHRYGFNQGWAAELLPPATFGLLVYGGLAIFLARRARVRFGRSYGVVQRPRLRPRAAPASSRELVTPV